MDKARIITRLEIIGCALLLCLSVLLHRTGVMVPESKPVTAEPEEQAVVVLDAGHGGADGGAVGLKTGVVEAGLNLTMVRLVEAALHGQGVRVVLTRTDENALAQGKNADMRARKEIISAPDVDLVVSIHMNKFSDRTVSGPMVFYMKGSEPGQRFAEIMVRNVCEAIGRPNRIANPGDYFMIRECSAPAVIVECGFLSNAEDELLLQDPAHQKKLAQGIAAGILEYIKAQP